MFITVSNPEIYEEQGLLIISAVNLITPLAIFVTITLQDSCKKFIGTLDYNQGDLIFFGGHSFKFFCQIRTVFPFLWNLSNSG